MTTQQLRERAEAPVSIGDWVAEKEVQHPGIGKVKDVYWDDISHEWVMDIATYSPDGDRRRSEPAVPCQYWDRCEKPQFPLSRDFSGFRDWRGSMEILAPRTAIDAALNPTREDVK
jgi:hypothetical protein